MIHLTASDYRVQPWDNGRGQTVELARADDAQGMLWRLSVATVAEDGPFSTFPGIDRSLTVIEGPGFRLCGEGLSLRADPLVPVAFPGDAALGAEGVSAPSRDFNAMWARRALRGTVELRSGSFAAEGQVVALYLLEPGEVTVEGHALTAAKGDLILTGGRVRVRAAPRLLAVTLEP